jgi:hypothetical protein
MSLLRFEIRVKPASSYCAARVKRNAEDVAPSPLRTRRVTVCPTPICLVVFFPRRLSTLDRSHTQVERDTTQQIFLLFFRNISLTPQTQNNIVPAGYMGVCLDGPSAKQGDLFAIQRDSNLQCEQKDKVSLRLSLWFFDATTT